MPGPACRREDPPGLAGRSARSDDLGRRGPNGRPRVYHFFDATSIAVSVCDRAMAAHLDLGDDVSHVAEEGQLREQPRLPERGPRQQLGEGVAVPPGILRLRLAVVLVADAAPAVVVVSAVEAVEILVVVVVVFAVEDVALGRVVEAGAELQEAVEPVRLLGPPGGRHFRLGLRRHAVVGVGDGEEPGAVAAAVGQRRRAQRRGAELEREDADGAAGGERGARRAPAARAAEVRVGARPPDAGVHGRRLPPAAPTAARPRRRRRRRCRGGSDARHHVRLSASRLHSRSWRAEKREGG